jgi:hypothetical protein
MDTLDHVRNCLAACGETARIIVRRFKPSEASDLAQRIVESCESVDKWLKNRWRKKE